MRFRSRPRHQHSRPSWCLVAWSPFSQSSLPARIVVKKNIYTVYIYGAHDLLLFFFFFDVVFVCWVRLLFVLMLLENIKKKKKNNTGISCHLHYWCIFIGYTLLYGSMTLKNYRILKIFNTSLRRVTLSDKQLALVKKKSTTKYKKKNSTWYICTLI